MGRGGDRAALSFHAGLTEDLLEVEVGRERAGRWRKGYVSKPAVLCETTPTRGCQRAAKNFSLFPPLPSERGTARWPGPGRSSLPASAAGSVRPSRGRLSGPSLCGRGRAGGGGAALLLPSAVPDSACLAVGALRGAARMRRCPSGQLRAGCRRNFFFFILPPHSSPSVFFFSFSLLLLLLFSPLPFYEISFSVRLQERVPLIRNKASGAAMCVATRARSPSPPSPPPPSCVPPRTDPAQRCPRPGPAPVALNKEIPSPGPGAGCGRAKSTPRFFSPSFLTSLPTAELRIPPVRYPAPKVYRRGGSGRVTPWGARGVPR